MPCLTNTSSDRLAVILAAPAPPPDGGITNWTRMIRKGIEDASNIDCVHVDTSLKREASKRGFLYSCLGVARIVNHARKILVETLKRPHPKLVMHLCTSGGLGFARDFGLLRIAHKYGIPAMLHLHFGRTPELFRGVSFEAFLMRAVFGLADGIMAMDSMTFQALRDCGYGSKSCLVPNPIDVVPSDNKESQEEGVIFVGHVIKSKGIEDLISAWNLIAEKHGRTNLMVVGPVNADYKEILLQSDETGTVSFTGSLPHEEVLQLIGAASVLVLPSYTEGFPNVVLEAMSLGTPIVATSVGAIPEILSEGVGLVVSPGDIEGLAEAIDTLLGNQILRSKMGKLGMDKVRNEYQLVGVLQSMRNEWLRMLGSSKFEV